MAPRHLHPLTPSPRQEIAGQLGRRLRRPVTAIAAGVVTGGLVGVGLLPAQPGSGSVAADATGAEPRQVTPSVAAARVEAPTADPAPQPDPAPAPTPAPAPAPVPAAVRPVDSYRLSSTFGPRWGTMHAGIDFAAPLGTPEKAVMAGTVVKAGAASGFGEAVYVQHDNGDVTVYGHMRTILVGAGEHVAAGQVIAEMGAEGQSTGPHLHLEVHVGGIGGTTIDPTPWLAARGVTV